MTKYTVKQLKDMIQEGVAIDISHADNAKRTEIEKEEEYYRQIGYASGIYGCNGKLLQGHKTGKLYAIAGRTQAIYIF